MSDTVIIVQSPPAETVEVVSQGPLGPQGPPGTVQLDCGAPDTQFLVAFSLNCGGVT